MKVIVWLLIIDPNAIEKHKYCQICIWDWYQDWEILYLMINNNNNKNNNVCVIISIE